MGQTKAQLGKTPSHVRTYHRQLHSPAWRSLSGSAVKVLLAIGSFERGENNGAIYFSERKGAELTGLSRNTVCRAIRELIEKGFVYCAERGGFSRKTAHAACYGLTWIAGPKGSPHRAPSHAYEAWRPDGNTPEIGITRAPILTETGPVSDETLETPPVTGSEMEPEETEKRLVSANQLRSEFGPQTVYHGTGSAEAANWKRKQLATDPRPFIAELRQALTARLKYAEPGTQSRLAKSVGIPGGTLSKFLHGASLPEKFAAALGRELMVATDKRDAPAPATESIDSETLRKWMGAVVRQLGYGAQRKLSADSGVPEPALSRFRSGRNLPEHYRLKLQEACGRALPFSTWEAAAA